MHNITTSDEEMPNLDALSGAVKEKLGTGNVVFSRLDFDVRVRFGETEPEAYLEWSEKGEAREIPATIRLDYNILL
ncbi:unnamed protein product [Rhizoctonia solani]|uniref:Uncharacterized protein n=1 Tax=Rhizoctonia solani TaxID=456999 RepID=A0A8H2Y6Z5_9AGAM|nr:unnamed protein product [Rhizoctonia solani]